MSHYHTYRGTRYMKVKKSFYETLLCNVRSK